MVDSTAITFLVIQWFSLVSYAWMFSPGMICHGFISHRVREYGCVSSSVKHYSLELPNTNTTLWTEITRRFQGDFDNYRQVVEDRKQGMFPREGGGHENIHSTLIPVSDSARLASFYFDGVPTAIFRFRYYQLIPRILESGDFVVDTLIYTLNPDLERQLRACAAFPSEWKDIFDRFDPPDNRVRLLPKCDVRWSWHRDPILHLYANDNGEGIHAVMVHGEATVESQAIPSQSIRILDQLSLFRDVMFIHDRGFDPISGDYIYGNRCNVPYQLDRVTNICEKQRLIVDKELEWTLGTDFRTDEVYQQRVTSMGGLSNPRSSS